MGMGWDGTDRQAQASKEATPRDERETHVSPAAGTVRHKAKIYTIDRLSPESETLRHPFWSYAARLKMGRVAGRVRDVPLQGE